MLPQIKDAGAADSVNGGHFSSAENSTTRLKQLKTINIKKNEKEKMKIQMLNLTDKMGPHEMRKKTLKTLVIYLSAGKNNYQRQ